MSTLTQSIRPAASLFVILTILTGLAYPLVVTGISQAILPALANGSLIQKDGQNIGSNLIGQSFTNPAYLWGRPSATAPTTYNGQASGGSNLGPLNPDLAKAVNERIATLQKADPTNTAPVPIDLVTASGSGLDPQISPNAAKYQAVRIARLRGLTVAQVQAVIDKNTEGRQAGLFGEPRVNVLQVNLALDQLSVLPKS
ncbi:potassium-transporting ATPase subunit KdpC [Aquirhabdus sp.]|uniref:potassium-transporting ATPase subunit KdpC n=1 Tax=Aquirhabdus sp. TaxID=2824160 RepID=UPI00396CCD8D